MPKTINILDALNQELTPSLDVVRFTESETAVILFTPNGESIDLHFCNEPEIARYLPCLGDTCLLCRIGRKKEPRLLFPVYLPTAKTIGVVSVSRSLRPFALLPQLGPVLRASKPMVAFVRREERTKFIVSTRELPDDVDGGEELIRQFQQDFEAGRVRLTSVYPLLDNHQLAQVTEIADLMKLKGIDLNASDSRT